MWTVPVVVVDPGQQERVSFLGVLIEPCVGPFPDGGLDEAFCFSVCSWSIDSGSDVSCVEGVTLFFEAIGEEAGSVIGHDAAQADVVLSEVSCCLAKKKACRDRLFIGHHGHVGHAGVVVDGDVEELPASAASLVLGIAGDAVSGLVDAGQLLDIDVQQVSGTYMFVPVGRQFWFEHADLIELKPGEDAADSGAAETCHLCDLNAGLALPPQLPDVLSYRLWGAARGSMRARAEVGQPRQAQGAITAEPLGSTLPAEPALGCRLAQAQLALHNAFCKLLSTVDGQSRMIVIVHSVS